MLKELANFGNCFESELVLESNLLRLRGKKQVKSHRLELKQVLNPRKETEK